MPKVSVLVPVYNAERFVGAAIESVLAQDYPCIEVIAVNDGSTDHSREVLSRYEGRITVIDQENRGAAAARNRAAAEAQGDYLLFFDGDDFLKGSHVSALVSTAEVGDACVISYSPWARFWDDPAPVSFPAETRASNLHGADWLVSEWRTTLPMMQPGMFLLPTSLVQEIGGWNERLTLIDDFEFFARAIARCDLMRFAPDAGLFYRSGLTGSLSGQKSRKAVESQLLSLTLGTSHLLAVRNDEAARRACANMLQQFVYEHYPAHPNLRAEAQARVRQLGGADIAPIGPPNFHRLRRMVGWKIARLVEKRFKATG